MKSQYIYSPILKWRAAEKAALKSVPEKDRERILPVIEIVLPSVSAYKDVVLKGKKTKVKKSDEEIHIEMVERYKTKRIPEIPNEIEDSWGKSAILIDYNLIHDGAETVNLKLESLRNISAVLSSKQMEVRPIVYLNDDPAIVNEIALQFSKNLIEGICIRVTLSDLKQVEELNKKLKEFLVKTKITQADIDLLVDIKYVGEEVKSIYGELFFAAQSILDLKEWKNFIFASGSFPVNVGHHKVEDSPCFEPRLDWQLWNTTKKSKKLLREPIFADYTIRYPMHSEALLFMQSSATLKYTHNDDWVIYRGEKKKNDQYLTHARLLVDGSGFFYGESFSVGDKKIKEKADYLPVYMSLLKKSDKNKGKGTGGSGYWIAVGISHHIALALSQISNQS